MILAGVIIGLLEVVTFDASGDGGGHDDEGDEGGDGQDEQVVEPVNLRVS